MVLVHTLYSDGRRIYANNIIQKVYLTPTYTHHKHPPLYNLFQLSPLNSALWPLPTLYLKHVCRLLCCMSSCVVWVLITGQSKIIEVVSNICINQWLTDCWIILSVSGLSSSTMASLAVGPLAVPPSSTTITSAGSSSNPTARSCCTCEKKPTPYRTYDPKEALGLAGDVLCPLDYHILSCTYILSPYVSPNHSYQTMTSFIGLMCYLDTVLSSCIVLTHLPY